MREHEIKSWPEFFEPVYEGEKTFELRKNDRNYQVGDVLVIREWKPPAPATEEKGFYTGRMVMAEITYVMEGAGSIGTILPLHGLALGYCILAIEVLSK